MEFYILSLLFIIIGKIFSLLGSFFFRYYGKYNIRYSFMGKNWKNEYLLSIN